MSEWKEYKLGEVLEMKYGKDHKTLLQGTIPCFGSGGIMRYVAEPIYKGESILIPRKGSLNNIMYQDAPFWTVDTMFWSKINQKKVNARFLYYQLKLKDFSILNVGSAVPSLTVPIINEIAIYLPQLTEQISIASVLNSLDNKIDLLQRQNTTLEKMAETLFRQWFVEKVNEEWKVGKLEDLFILQRGYDLPMQKRIEGTYPIYASSGHSGFHNEYKVVGPGVTTGRSGILGKVFYIPEDFWPLNTSLFIKEYRNSSPLHAYFTLKGLNLNIFNAGSAVPTLNRNHVHEITIEIPPVELIMKFDNWAQPLFNKIKRNQLEVNNLISLRDMMLPKLMSGELKVTI